HRRTAAGRARRAAEGADGPRRGRDVRDRARAVRRRTGPARPRVRRGAPGPARRRHAVLLPGRRRRTYRHPVGERARDGLPPGPAHLPACRSGGPVAAAAGRCRAVLVGVDAVIRTEAVTKRYGSVLAVDAADLDVREGDRYGLLGPNGSGKTTLVRMLLGLVFATSGRIEVLGEPVPRRVREVLPRIGALVEGPAGYGH